MLCVYHSGDLDGHCAGAIVKNKYPDCEMYGMDYGEEFDWHKIDEHDEIVMVDFSLPVKDMSRIWTWRLRDDIRNFVWIDHHKSKIETVPSCIPGLRDVNFAACELAWKYFYTSVPMPEAVRLLGRYDVFDHSDENTFPFQYGARSYWTDPKDNMGLWNSWFYSFPKQVLLEGPSVWRYQGVRDRKLVTSCSFETKIRGFEHLSVIAANSLFTGSQLFEAIWDEEKHDVMLVFGWMGKAWRISLYTTKNWIDVSKIAESFGGGGHKQAAGFVCDLPPFPIFKIPMIEEPEGEGPEPLI